MNLRSEVTSARPAKTVFKFDHWPDTFVTQLILASAAKGDGVAQAGGLGRRTQDREKGQEGEALGHGVGPGVRRQV